jgi:lathosterol oxidase
VSPVEIFAFVFTKFLIIFCGSYFLIKKNLIPWAQRYAIQTEPRPSAKPSSEFFYSFLAVLIAGLMLFFVQLGSENSFWIITSGWSSRSLAQNLVSLLGYFLIYDTYFFFTHWLLHQGFLYKKVHIIHHRSLSPNPLSSYSFHPVETVINFAYIFLVVSVLPLSWEMLMLLLVLSDIGNVAGHLGFEPMPRWLLKYPWSRWITTPTHHNLHHQVPRTNFGLYFRGWDILFKKLHPQTDALFRSIHEREKQG